MSHLDNALTVEPPWHLQNNRTLYQRKIVDTRAILDKYEACLKETNEAIQEYLAPYQTLEKANEGEIVFPVLTSFSK